MFSGDGAVSSLRFAAKFSCTELVFRDPSRQEELRRSKNFEKASSFDGKGWENFSRNW